VGIDIQENHNGAPVMKQTHRIYLRANDVHSRRASHAFLHPSAAPCPEDRWIDVIETAPGNFVVVDDNLTVKNASAVTNETHLGFLSWDDDVTRAGLGTDVLYDEEWECLRIATKLAYKGVSMTPYCFTLTPFHTQSRRFELLHEALSRVSVTAYCPGDV